MLIRYFIADYFLCDNGIYGGVLGGGDLNGALGRIRTPDLLIRSQTLYPAELRARITKPKATY